MKRVTHRYIVLVHPSWLDWNANGSEVKVTFWSEGCFVVCEVLDIRDVGIKSLADGDAATRTNSLEMNSLKAELQTSWSW
jgi:hypothetical protein